MTFSTIIAAQELVNHLNDPDWVIVDSRFKLAKTDQGRLDFETAHIPGAVYTHLDDDLS
jgi:thiosulfate/3-mercaptopyruvate sulfurtransferase